MPNVEWFEPYKTQEPQRIDCYRIYEGKWIRREYKRIKTDFIPLIKWMPNICKWFGLGRMVRRNKRRV